MPGRTQRPLRRQPVDRDLTQPDPGTAVGGRGGDHADLDAVDLAAVELDHGRARRRC